MMRGGGGGGGGGGRRRGAKLVQSERWIFKKNRNSSSNNRDSDASYGSSRPSSTGRLSIVPLNDRSYQSSALHTINYFLSSYSTPFNLKPPLPSAKDITETIRFIFNRLDWFIDTTTNNFKLDEELPVLLKHLNCPIKLNKSSLKAPVTVTAHTWPPLLAVIHWLVQICQYNDHISSSSSSTTSTSTNRSFLEDNMVFSYALESYSLYICGDDDAVEALDREFTRKLEKVSESAANKVKMFKEEVSSLEAELESLRSAPSAREALEKDKFVLEEKIRKLHITIDQRKNGIATLEKELEEKQKELDTKLEANKRINEENEELKKRTKAQTVNLRDAERMKRELQVVERDIADAEVARNAWEEKSWDLDRNINSMFKKLESLSMECNQAIRRLKLGNDFQYALNAKGTTPAEVLGIDYKSTLKLALSDYDENKKKTYVAKLEELISLQQQLRENATKIEAKRNCLTELQSKIDEIESQLQLIKKETHDYTSQCAEESRRMLESSERDRLNLDTMEREAEEFLKISELKLEKTINQTDKEIQMCANELLALVDLVSKYKESTGSVILEMKRGLSETVETVAKAISLQGISTSLVRNLQYKLGGRRVELSGYGSTGLSYKYQITTEGLRECLC